MLVHQRVSEYACSSTQKEVRSSASPHVKTWQLITLKMVVRIEGTPNVLFTNRDPFHYWFTHSKSILVPHVLKAIQKHRK